MTPFVIDLGHGNKVHVDVAAQKVVIDCSHFVGERGSGTFTRATMTLSPGAEPNFWHDGNYGGNFGPMSREYVGVILAKVLGDLADWKPEP